MRSYLIACVSFIRKQTTCQQLNESGTYNLSMEIKEEEKNAVRAQDDKGVICLL